jgi:addiction module RelE/StbE family toxin
MYKLRYLPLAQKDMEDITDYISDTLKAPQAAMDLLDAVETGINRLQAHPFSCRVYQALRQVDLEYRALVVKNYLVFYIVLDDYVEIHRIVYSRRDLPQILREPQ